MPQCLRNKHIQVYIFSINFTSAHCSISFKACMTGTHKTTFRVSTSCIFRTVACTFNAFVYIWKICIAENKHFHDIYSRNNMFHFHHFQLVRDAWIRDCKTAWLIQNLLWHSEKEVVFRIYPSKHEQRNPPGKFMQLWHSLVLFVLHSSTSSHLLSLINIKPVWQLQL